MCGGADSISEISGEIWSFLRKSKKKEKVQEETKRELGNNKTECTFDFFIQLDQRVPTHIELLDRYWIVAMKISNVVVVVLALHLFQLGRVSALCDEDYHVVNHACVACPSGQSNLAGDDPSGQDTSCDTCKITTNQELRDHVDSWIANPTSCHPCGSVIGEWEIGRITDMSYVFCADEFISQCYLNRKNFNSDISKWNTASVTTSSLDECSCGRDEDNPEHPRHQARFEYVVSMTSIHFLLLLLPTTHDPGYLHP